MGLRRAASTVRGFLLAVCLLGCSAGAPRSLPIPGVTVGAPCREGHCAEGLSCHHGGKDAGGSRCMLETGRCRSDWDCARGLQRCRRFGDALGVCQD